MLKLKRLIFITKFYIYYVCSVVVFVENDFSSSLILFFNIIQLVNYTISDTITTIILVQWFLVSMKIIQK